MGKQRKHSNSRASDFSDYLGGRLRGKDRNAFERRLQKDPFEAEAAEGLELVSREEMEEDLRLAAAKIRRRISRRRRIAWYSAAAAVASLMIVATVFFNIDDGSMDRYRTAPEFEEAAQEQPDAPSMVKKETRKDVIPDAADGKAAELLPIEGTVEEPVTGAGREEGVVTEGDREEDRVHAKVQEEEPLPGKGREEVQVTGVDKEEDRVQAKVQEEEPVMKEEVDDSGGQDLNLQDQVLEATRQDVVSREPAGELSATDAAAAEAVAAEPLTRKRTVRETFAVPALQKPAQDNIPDAEIAQPLEDRIRKPEEKGDEETIQAEGYQEEIARQLQGQVAGVNVTQNLQGEVSGIVYSADDLEPLPGVTLFIKGSTTGTVSDVNGRFSLNSTDVNGSTLVANYIGMQTEEIPLDYSQPMEIAMVPDAVQLDEVVVVGHASSSKTALTGAVTKVEPDPGSTTEYIHASPVDGIIDYKKYIDSTLAYPADTQSANKEVVVLKFSVTPEGRPRDFKVIRSPGDAFSREAIRAVTEGPGWFPATRNGMYVDDEVRLRIVFRTDH